MARRRSTLERIAERFQDDLLRIERRDAAAIASAYRDAFRRMSDVLDAAKAAAGGAPEGLDPVTWLRENQRVRALRAAAAREMNAFAQYAADTIEARQLELVRLAEQHAREVATLQATGEVDAAARLAQREGQTHARLGVVAQELGSIVPAFRTVPIEAVTQLVGHLGDGTALSDWAKQFGPESARKIGETLIDGVTRGQGAETIGRALRSSLDGDAARALTVARTESMRAYRESKTTWMKANTAFVKGWLWHSRADSRACASCLAMNGTFHSVDESMGTHPNCRCIPIPKTKSFDEMAGKPTGVNDTSVALPSGEELLGKMTPAQQRQVLGAKGYELYRKGKVSLSDFVAERHSDAWGTTRTAASPAQALKNAKARR